MGRARALLDRRQSAPWLRDRLSQQAERGREDGRFSRRGSPDTYRWVNGQWIDGEGGTLNRAPSVASMTTLFDSSRMVNRRLRCVRVAVRPGRCQAGRSYAGSSSRSIITSVDLMRAAAASPFFNWSSRTAFAVMMAVTCVSAVESTTSASRPSIRMLTILPAS